MTSSLSNRVKTRRKPLSLLKSRSTSLRLLYSSLSYSHGFSRLGLGGTTGVKPNSRPKRVVSLPSYAPSISKLHGAGIGPNWTSSLRPSGASPALPGVRLKFNAHSALRRSGAFRCSSASGTPPTKPDGFQTRPTSLGSRLKGLRLAVPIRKSRLSSERRLLR